MIYGYFSGYSSHNSENFCPLCGSEIKIKYGDGSASCDKCGVRFAVIEIDESEGEDE